MKAFSAEMTVPYPTPYMQGLFPSLSDELDNLEVLLGQELLLEDRTNHRRMLTTLRDLLASNYAALALFLAYPTQRLSVVLLTEVGKADAALGWLLDNRPSQITAAGFEQRYVVCCERIRAGLANWQQSVDLKRMMAELDGWTPERMH
jgi:hypothetical protein